MMRWRAAKTNRKRRFVVTVRGESYKRSYALFLPACRFRLARGWNLWNRRGALRPLAVAAGKRNTLIEGAAIIAQPKTFCQVKLSRCHPLTVRSADAG